RIIQAPPLPEGYRWGSRPMPAVVKEFADDCGLRIGPAAGGIVTRCPNCEAEVYLLRGAVGGWTCRWCYRARWNQLEVSLGAYAMGLRIHLGGRQMVRRRRRLLEALSRLVMHARGPKDLLLIAAGGALVGQYSPHWRRSRPGAGLPTAHRQGGLWPAIQRVYMPAMIDGL